MRNFFENMTTVQLNHRMLAYATYGGMLGSLDLTKELQL